MKTLKEFILKDKEVKFLFFGGKGGVGKTTMAAATAVWLADNGYKTTIVSTDPTVSLPSIFHQEIDATQKTEIKLVKNLCGVNINPEEATGAFQGRLSSTLGGLTETLGSDLISVPCAEEMAAFDQFVQFLDSQDDEVVVFDTAPTGHSLRELALPFDWANFMQKAVKERKELAVLLKLGDSEDAINHLQDEKARYDRAIKVLQNKERTAYTLVMLPAYLPIQESESAIRDLTNIGIFPAFFIINQVLPDSVIQGNKFLMKRYETQEKYMTIIKEKFGNDKLHPLPLLDTDVYDVDTIRMIGKILYS